MKKRIIGLILTMAMVFTAGSAAMAATATASWTAKYLAGSLAGVGTDNSGHAENGAISGSNIMLHVGDIGNFVEIDSKIHDDFKHGALTTYITSADGNTYGLSATNTTSRHCSSTTSRAVTS